MVVIRPPAFHVQKFLMKNMIPKNNVHGLIRNRYTGKRNPIEIVKDAVAICKPRDQISIMDYVLTRSHRTVHCMHGKVSRLSRKASFPPQTKSHIRYCKLNQRAPCNQITGHIPVLCQQCIKIKCLLGDYTYYRISKLYLNRNRTYCETIEQLTNLTSSLLQKKYVDCGTI